MNQQTNQPTEQISKAGVTPPEITSLGSQETVAASIGAIFDDPTLPQPLTEPISPVVPIKEINPQPEPKPEIPPAATLEVNSDNHPVETFTEEASAPFETTESSADNLPINPLEPVIEQPLSVTPNTETVTAEHRAVQRMLKNSEFVGVEKVVVDYRKRDTQNISLS